MKIDRKKQDENYLFYKENLPSWVRDEACVNHFVVISSKELKSKHKAFDEALREALSKYTVGEFIIQLVSVVELENIQQNS